MTPSQFCALHNACPDGRVFASQYATLAEVWDACQRPDWMLWMCEKAQIKPDKLAIRLFACWCADSTPGAAPLADPRSINAVRVSRLYANGEATAEELSAASSAAWSAASSAAWSAASSEASSAAWSAASSAAWSAASSAASSAAWLAAWSAQADALRSFIPNPFKDMT